MSFGRSVVGGQSTFVAQAAGIVIWVREDGFYRIWDNGTQVFALPSGADAAMEVLRTYGWHEEIERDLATGALPRSPQ